MPTVAIVTRTKSRPLLLSRALKDIAGQSFTDWHLAIINDGGDPAEIETLITSTEGLDPVKVTLVNNTESRGTSTTANQGVNATESEFIVLHDDDDLWHADFLARTVAYLRENPEAPGVTARTMIVHERQKGDSFEEYYRFEFEPLPFVSYYDLLAVNRFVPISFLYRRSLHDELGLYREDLPVVEDWEFYLRIARRYQIAKLPGEPLAFWQQRPEATGASGNTVFVAQQEHMRWDRFVRDEAMTAHCKRYGDGDLLLMARGFRDVIDKMTVRIDQLEAQIADNQRIVVEEVQKVGLIALARRKYWQAKSHFTKSE